MSESIERPLSLTPSLSSAIGNERSNKMISDACNEGFRHYSELMAEDWDRADALRGAVATMVGSLETKIHHLAAEVEGDE